MFKIATILLLLVSQCGAFGSSNVVASATGQVKAAGVSQPQMVIDPLSDCVLPEIVSGGKWRTSIVIVNLQATDAKVKFYFANDNGEDFGFPWQDVGFYSNVVVTIPGHGMYTLRTELNPDAEIREGWSMLIQNGNTSGTYGKVAAHTIVEFDGRETIIPLTTVMEKKVVVPLDNANDVKTAMAIVNFDTMPRIITIRVFSINGELIRTELVPVVAAGRLFLDTSKIPDINGTKTLVEFTTSGDFMAVYGMRMNPNGSGSFSMFPSFSLKEWQY